MSIQYVNVLFIYSLFRPKAGANVIHIFFYTISFFEKNEIISIILNFTIY